MCVFLRSAPRRTQINTIPSSKIWRYPSNPRTQAKSGYEAGDKLYSMILPQNKSTVLSIGEDFGLWTGIRRFHPDSVLNEYVALAELSVLPGLSFFFSERGQCELPRVLVLCKPWAVHHRANLQSPLIVLPPSEPCFPSLSSVNPAKGLILSVTLLGDSIVKCRHSNKCSGTRSQEPTQPTWRS